MTIPLAPQLPAGSSCQPGPLGSKCPAAVSPAETADQPRARPLFGVAPGGACRAGPVTSPAVGSYPTVSPLPAASGGRFHFCGAFPGVAPAGRYPAPFLHGVRTFLACPGFRERTHEHTRSSSHPREGGLRGPARGVNENAAPADPARRCQPRIRVSGSKRSENPTEPLSGLTSPQERRIAPR